MILIVSLAIAGLLLIYFELFLPHLVLLGVLGGILLLASIFLYTFVIHPTVISLLFYIAAVLVSVFLTIRLGLITLKRKKEKSSFYQGKDHEKHIESIHQKELYGKIGLATTDLKPLGYVKIEEDFYQAISKSGEIKKDEKVQVDGGEGARVIVKKI